MPYSHLNNSYSRKGLRVRLGDRVTLQQELTDEFNIPLVLQMIDPDDSENIIRRDFRWRFIENRVGGRILTFTDVSLLNPDKGQVELIINPNTLVSSEGYNHELAMKWPYEDENQWQIVATGPIIIVTRSGDRSALLVV